MGNPGKHTYDPSIQHFSHEHQLQLLNIKDQPTLNLVSCAGCKLKPSEWVYACKLCSFILDIPCSRMPKLIHHPADLNHTFTLLAKPAYPTGLFRCDACGNNGDGFNYHCGTCGLDIHAICATMPLSLTHQTHRCPLKLTFSPPYPTKDFSCDVCRGHGSNHWVYRCNPCGFDAHLYCATNKPPSSPSTGSAYQHQTRSPVYPQPQYVQPAGLSTAEQARANFIQNYMTARQADQARIQSMIQSNNGGLTPEQLRSLFGGKSAASAVTEQYLQSMMRANNNGMTQQFTQGMFGGGQQAGPNLMGGNFGGGAGQQFNQDFMQNLYGGGGGGQDFLQNILGGGGSGVGVDGAWSLLQNMFGGF